MPWINLKAPWTYIESGERSIGFKAGKYNVINDIAKAAKDQGRLDNGNADHTDTQDRVDGPEAGDASDSTGPGSVDPSADATG